jgi:hypothetical protein
MRRPILLATVTVAAAAAAVSGATLASGQAPAQSTTLTLTATPTGGSGLDLGRKGVSVGDQFFEHGRLRGDAPGHYQLVTELVAGNGRHGTERNELSLTLPGGQVEASGMHRTVDRFTTPISGGTGSYQGARGILSIAPGKHGSETVAVTLER